MAKQAEVEQILKRLASDVSRQIPSSETYGPPEQLKVDSQKTPKELLDSQRPGHRKVLLVLVCALSIASFLLLAFIVLFQMWKRIDNPDYTGVSDIVINILAASVFAELIAVVAAISRYVWQDPK